METPGSEPRTLPGAHRDHEAGEGVISAAIAVLVMAFIGVLMWVAFSGSFERAADSVDDRIAEIGG